MKSFKKLGGIIGVVGCLQFLIFSTIAMFNYTGGTSWDKSAEGYTFWHNVMSDLGRTVSYSGISNTFSSALFNSSLFIFGMSIVIIYLSMKKRLSLSDNFITFIMIFGIISDGWHVWPGQRVSRRNALPGDMPRQGGCLARKLASPRVIPRQEARLAAGMPRQHV